jgi:hypothetical protein
LSFPSVQARFGHAVVATRGDASTGRMQICYASEGRSPIRLIFEKGFSNFSFYMLGDAQYWNGQALCTESSQVNARLKTGSGLGIGMSPAEVEQILGKADISNGNKLVYQREIEKQTPADKLAELRREHSEISEAEFHDTYDSYELDLYIEARFSESKLTYLAVSRSESY